MPNTLQQRRGEHIAADEFDLSSLDAFLVKQEVEPMEAVTGIETENSYIVLGARAGKGVCQMVAIEKSSFLARCLCGNRRPFTLNIVAVPLETGITARSGLLGSSIDERMRTRPPLLVIERPFKLFLQEVSVRNGPTPAFGQPASAPLGGVRQSCVCGLRREFMLSDAGGNPRLKIICWFKLSNLLFPRHTFEVHDLHGNAIGAIKKKWAGLVQELATDADNFGVELPEALPPQAKALVLAAVFLVDFLYFEDNDANSQTRRDQRRRRRGF